MKQSDIQVTLIDSMGSDLSVVNAARVSFNKESEFDLVKDTLNYPFEDSGRLVLKEADAKLIRYLANHKHYSPFNHTFITLRIKAPIFVARQLVKHKFLPWNEVSRRYVDDEPEFYFPDVWRAKAENVKQGSSEQGVDINPKFMTYASVGESLKEYNRMLSLGVCAEQARMVLPQNMMTEWWWSGSLGAWCDMLILRLDKHTQYETRVVAEKTYDLIEPLFPVSVKARMEAAGVSRY